ncbi:hypothetical protein CMK22_03085 [Candidatus Poribacteria bacterium]|nr:hypothetical protein [Candidatus Poribacteria bacterium]
MTLRYKILYMSFGAGLVILGIVLNSLISGNVNAQVDMEDAVFENITVEIRYSRLLNVRMLFLEMLLLQMMLLVEI